MWLFDARGFVSVVAYDPSKDRNKTSKFQSIVMASPENKDGYTHTHLLVRARILEDLDMLKTVVSSLHVETDKAADYAFRCVVTRKQYKTFLAKAVDGIDYDSHFKEACRDRAPKADGRYSALMSVWGTMSRLQPHTPYGHFGGYGDYDYSGKSKGSTTSAFAKPKPAVTYGADDLADFWDNHDAATSPDAFRTGKGPRTGFKVGDQVIGYFGEGVVKFVTEGKGTNADMLSIEYVKDGKTKTANYVSNYVIPADTEEDDKDDTLDMWDLEEAYDFFQTHPDVNKFDIGLLGFLDDEAFELLTQLQELEIEGDVPKAKITEVYEDVLWTTASDDVKKQLAKDGAVPEKYVSEMAEIFSSE